MSSLIYGLPLWYLQTFSYYRWVHVTAGGHLVPKDIIRPVAIKCSDVAQYKKDKIDDICILTSPVCRSVILMHIFNSAPRHK
jgi:hypothetical protein